MEKILDPVLSVWEREPVAVIAVVDALLMLVASFGLPVTPEQKGAIDGLLGAIGVMLARSQVTPNAKVDGIAEDHYVLGVKDAVESPHDPYVQHVAAGQDVSAAPK